MKKKSNAKTVKDEKMDKIKKLVRKENEANKKFKNFGGSVSLGKFAILDSSDEDDDRRSAPSPRRVPTSQAVSTVVNDKPAKRKSDAHPVPIRTTNKSRVKKDSKKSSPMTKAFVIGLSIGAALLIARHLGLL